MEKFKVTFLPDNKTLEVDKDTTILSAATALEVYIHSACGGDGVCGRCKVIVKSGKVMTQPNGAISLDEKRKQVHLACLTTVHSDVVVEVPAESRMDFERLTPEELELRLKGLYSESEEVEGAPAGDEPGFSHSPLVAKKYLELPEPNLDDRISDLERVQRAIGFSGQASTGLVGIKLLGELLRDSDWKVTVTVGQKDHATEILFVEPQNTSAKNFGFAFDIGTTTISGQLIDLNTGKIIGTRQAYNKQVSFGSDVITRIIYAHEEDGLEKLHNAVSDTVNQIIKELAHEHDVNLNDVTCILCAGNTTMIHLLLSIDPKFIRRQPYVPTANFIPVLRAQEADITTINSHGLLSCVPGVSSYIGGDTTAGILSSGLYKEKDLCVLIDIGTNGEIALGNRDFLVAAAASAGPAFEGSGVACGMRASVGAIQKVKISCDLQKITCGVIGKAMPRGICGSGYIDIISQLLENGIMDKSGKIIPEEGRRIRRGQEGKELVIAFKEDTGTGKDIVITESDIENLKRSKAAIFSATAILSKHMGLELSQVSKFFIAGGFGTTLDIENAVRIGLLPDLPRSKFMFIGNSALAGARQMLLSGDARKKAEEIARKITYFELSVDPGYMDEYMAALFFPHTDLNKFPSVKA